MGKLRRSRRDRWIAGICGGLGEFFGIESIWFRLVFFFLGLPGGFPGILLYLVLWLAVPPEESA